MTLPLSSVPTPALVSRQLRLTAYRKTLSEVDCEVGRLLSPETLSMFSLLRVGIRDELDLVTAELAHRERMFSPAVQDGRMRAGGA
jgi:hypothetical protein